MDQLEANMAVVSEEQLRLHNSPGQVEMDFGRREATQRALMRLVTPESDDEWRSSPSSSGIVIRFLFCFDPWLKQFRFSCGCHLKVDHLT